MVRSTLLAGLCLLAGLLRTLSAAEVHTPKLHVPDGFVIEKVAGEPNVVFPMFAVFDDRGRLFVTESSGLDLYAELKAGTRKCRVRLLEDRDGDGRFETSHVFADKLVFPMGLAWRDGQLYVADPPDLVTYEAQDGDRQAGKRTVILSSFGHIDNGSLHGLIFGPDGWLYLTMGDPDGYKLKRRDGTFVEGKTGALLRCRPDGSDPEVLCGGFENLVEIAFTPRGEIFGTNNWYQLPSGGVRDALVHLVEGGLYPTHHAAGTPVPTTGEPLPAVTLFPAVAMSGLMRYRGDAFPAEMRGNLFSAQHNARKVVRHVLVPEGSTFRAQNFDFVTTDDPDFHPSDVLEAADGSLIVIDTGSWYVHHCPTGQIRKTHAPGGIYRVKPTQPVPLADPWGLKVDCAHATAEQLVALLRDRRPFVRDRAQRNLAARGKETVAVLASILDNSGDVSVKQRAIWALAANPEPAALVPLRKVAHDANPEIVAPAIRALGRRQDRQSGPALDRLLAAEAPPVRMAAAEALAHCGDAKSLPSLWQALARQPDRFFEHSLIHALHFLGHAPDLEAALQNPSPQVQKAALLLLDQPPRPHGQLTHEAVIQRVTAADADLRQTALRILQRHPEWAEMAIGLVRSWLEKPKLSQEETVGLRSLLIAFQGQKAVQDLVGSTVVNHGNKMPAERQVLVLETLAQSSLPELPEPWIKALSEGIRQSVPAVRIQAVRSVAVLQLPQFDNQLAQLAQSKEQPLELRLEALRAIVARRPNLSTTSYELLMGQLGDSDSPVARLAAAEVLGRSHLNDAQLSQLLQQIRGDALISPSVMMPALKRSTTAATAPSVLDYLTESIRTGWRPSEEELLKVLKALPPALQAKASQVREVLRKSTAEQRARLTKFEPLLNGGKAERGRAVFYGKKVACATCHRIGNDGGQVGPDLTKVGAIRSGRDILESIILPSSTIAQGYEPYYLATADGRVASGVIARQSADTLVLRDSSGAELRFRKDQIQEMKRQATSIMPEGLERALTNDELRDLLAFLKNLK